MSTEAVVYLDSSAIVKLVVEEDESKALIKRLSDRPTRVSCALARLEVIRAVRPHGQPAVYRARATLGAMSLLRLDDLLLDDAAALNVEGLRAVDALHLAAARTLGTRLSEFITYDRRMAQAAEAMGLPVGVPV
jgi:predicted nucleic acid-binding protein